MQCRANSCTQSIHIGPERDPRCSLLPSLREVRQLGTTPGFARPRTDQPFCANPRGGSHTGQGTATQRHVPVSVEKKEAFARRVSLSGVLAVLVLVVWDTATQIRATRRFERRPSRRSDCTGCSFLDDSITTRVHYVHTIHATKRAPRSATTSPTTRLLHDEAHTPEARGASCSGIAQPLHRQGENGVPMDRISDSTQWITPKATEGQ